MKAVGYVLASLLFVMTSATGQVFTNLNFESANVPPTPGPVPFANAFPGWQAVRGGTYPSFGVTNLSLSPVSIAYHNATDLDQMTIGIYDNNAVPIVPGAAYPIFGTYTAYIEADLGSMHLGGLDLMQTGVVPSDAQSLRFRTTSYSSLAGVSAQFSVRINGTTVPFVPALFQPTSTIWAADISPYASTLSEVRFEVRATYPFPGFDPHVFVGLGLDSISFSPIPVPEPSANFLLLTGMVGWALGRRRRGRSQ